MDSVSVVMPLYNHECYVEESIFSVINQNYPVLELIVIDDGSSDNSGEIVKKNNDSRVKYVFQENKGAHDAINKALSLSKGKYIAIINSDDVYHPSRIEKCLESIKCDTSIDAVFSSVDYIDDKSKYLNTVIGAEENWQGKEAGNSFASSRQLTLDLLAGNFIKTTSNLFCRAECFDKVGLFRNLRYTHDYDFFLRLSSQCKVKFIEEPLLKYRVHPGNTLKEDQAAVDFECALVISNFLMNHDLSKIIDPELPDSMSKLLNSLNTHRAERVMLVFAIFAGYMGDKEQLFLSILDDPDHPFRKAGRDFICNYHDGWQAREEIYQEWHKLHAMYVQSEEQLQQAERSLGYRIEKKIRYYLNKMTGSI
ncbi:glycosyltransferase [Desulfogranum marinum]|uniref:glycosyltransferase n=1 Tax=Desulfogranum marinum TaxID=453220 RepID=UPI00196309EE|nr:glycosyltransferase [Desulfogranum marinum]MBM9513015.1 glycosyltransferase [Desulfogranum marinum]